MFTDDSGGCRDMVSAVAAPVATAAGITVGSSTEAVLQAYPDQVEMRPRAGVLWLVHTPADPALADYAIVFVVQQGQVTSYTAGRRTVVEADEACV